VGVGAENGDPWADEGFGGEDEWGAESLASDLEETEEALGESSPGEGDAQESVADDVGE
jgi:hypothetical protein